MIDWRTRAEQIGAAAGIPWFSKQIDAESGFDPLAISPAGAQGIAQFMPGTAASLGIDPFDPEQALQAAAQLDATNRRKYGSDAVALAAYNAGPGAVDKYGGVPPFPETISYIDRILGSGASSAPASSSAAIDPNLPGDKSCAPGFHLQEISILGVRYNRCIPDTSPADAVGTIVHKTVTDNLPAIAPIGVGLLVAGVIVVVGLMGLREVTS